MNFAKPTGRIWLVLAVPVLALLSYIAANKVVGAIDYQTDYSDFVPFWLAGNLTANGQNPYDATIWAAGYAKNGAGEMLDHSFLYPLPLAFFFVPFGLLSLRIAHVLWVALTLFFIFAVTSSLSLTRQSLKSKLLIPFILIGVIFFRPAVLSVTTGHISGLLLVVLTASLFLFEKNKTFWGGVLLAFTMLKPNLGMILIPCLLTWFIRRKDLHAVLGLASTGLFLPAAGLLYAPHWLSEYWQVGSGKLAQTFGFSPTIWGLSNLACNHQQFCALTAGAVVSIFLLSFVLWRLARFPNTNPLNAFSLSIALTLLITPYTWTYDQLLLLIPISAVIFFWGELKRGFLPAALLFPILNLLIVLLLFYNTPLQVEILNGLIPLVVLIPLLHLTRSQTLPPSFGY
ncbi:MAG: DUF2029 domain-containing protein [Chloroflexi bacterium]|nr:DUF2029 domain-containing protein [Chloroflexota bacterium]